MTEKDLDDWFDSLDSEDLTNMFPSEYEHTMMSADPDDNINAFYDEVRNDWKTMTKEEKEELYNMFQEQ